LGFLGIWHGYGFVDFTKENGAATSAIEVTRVLK
jgi:hypothetical protein